MRMRDSRTEKELRKRTRLGRDIVRRFLTSFEVARLCGVPYEQVLEWIDSGRLRASYLPIGYYRITVENLLVFLHRSEFAISP